MVILSEVKQKKKKNMLIKKMYFTLFIYYLATFLTSINGLNITEAPSNNKVKNGKILKFFIIYKFLEIMKLNIINLKL